MKESLWGYWLIILGIGISAVMIFLQNYTTTNQQDYYLAKEITYAAMYDAIDYGYYKKNGELKIVKEKFVENFVRRFAESATLNKNYTLNFYTIYEIPPAVSIEIKADGGAVRFGKEEINENVTSRLTALLEISDKPSTVVLDDIPVEIPSEEISVIATYYDFPYGKSGNSVDSSNSFGLYSSYNSQILTDLYDEYRLRMNANGKTPKNWEEFNNNVEISLVGSDLIDSADGQAAYENYVDVLCANNSCVEGELSSSTIDDMSANTKYVPHSVLYKLKNDGMFQSYFGTGRITISPKLYYGSSVVESSTANNIGQLSVKSQLRFSNCSNTLKEGVGIGKKRIKFNKIYSSEVRSNLAPYSNMGYFGSYDYYYRPGGGNYASSVALDVNIFQDTPYYNKCLLGVRYNIKYSYKIDYDVE